MAPDPGGLSLPGGAEPVFHAPWQARLFAITVGLVDRGLLTWPDWTGALAAACSDMDGGMDADANPGLPGDPARQADRYYRAWAQALADVLADRGVIAPQEVAECAAAWQEAAERTPHGQPIALRG